MSLAGRVPALLLGLVGGIVAMCGGALAASVAPPSAASRSAPAEPAPALPLATVIPTGSISGTVVSSADRTPLARARVLLTSAALAEPRVALSGTDGTYRFPHLPAGSFSLSATRSGYVPQEYGERRFAPSAPVTLGDGQQLAGIDFAMAPAGVIAGRVLDEDGQPFSGATVDALVSRTEAGAPTLVPIARAQSDDRGEFRLTGLAAGQYYVSAFDPAFANVGDETGPLRYTATYYPGVAFVEQATRVSVTAGVEPAQRISFSLKIVRPARVSGIIGTEDRRPLMSGAVIMTPVHGQGLIPVPTQDVMILPDGSFAFRNVPPGRYQIRARGEVDGRGAALFATFKVAVEGRDIGNVNMVLRPGASAAGRVVVESARAAKPPGFAGWRVRAPFADGSSFGDALTGEVLADGSFVVGGLMSGSHILTVEGAPYPWVLKSVLYRGQDITDLGFDVDNRQRVEDLRVTITDVATDLSGVVRDGSGRVVADATVLIIPLSQQFWTRTSRRLGLLRTDAGGRYRVRGLPAGEYRAVASLEMDESEAYRPGLLKDFSDAGVSLSLKNLEARVLDLPLTSMAAAAGGTRRQEAGGTMPGGDRRQEAGDRVNPVLVRVP